MSNQKCGRCGKDPAEGYAFIGDVRYCHEGDDPTCYMLASWGRIAARGSTGSPRSAPRSWLGPSEPGEQI